MLKSCCFKQDDFLILPYPEGTVALNSVKSSEDWNKKFHEFKKEAKSIISMKNSH